MIATDTDPTLQSRAKIAVDLGLRNVAAQQLASGEFLSYWATDVDMREDLTPDASVFATAQVISSLVGMKKKKLAQKIIARGADFLEAQAMPSGIWRFWTKEHPGYLNMPPDVDDTSCVRYALQEAGRPQTATEQAARSILMGNRAPDGRFYTWMIRRPRHRFRFAAREGLALIHRDPERLESYFNSTQVREDEIDAVANANALLWLQAPWRTRSIARWIRRVVREGTEEEADRYYQSSYALYYAIVRCSASGLRDFEGLRGLIVQRLEAWQLGDGSYGSNSLETALATKVLSHWAPQSGCLPRAFGYLCGQQLEDGAWPNRAFYYAGRIRFRTWGCPQMVTAFCLEALSDYLKRKPANP